MEKSYDIVFGIDNGTTGSLGVVTGRDVYFYSMPSYETQDYTKHKKGITRLDFIKFGDILDNHLRSISMNYRTINSIAMMERPLVNPSKFQTSLNAVRCFEAQLVALEHRCIKVEIIDSKEWQKEMLPENRGGTDLKQKSFDIGLELYPHLAKEIIKQNEADGLLIAAYTWRKGQIIE